MVEWVQLTGGGFPDAVAMLKVTPLNGPIEPSVYGEVHERKLAETHPAVTAEFLSLLVEKCYAPVQDHWDFAKVMDSLVGKLEAHKALERVLNVMSSKSSTKARQWKEEMERVRSG